MTTLGNHVTLVNESVVYGETAEDDTIQCDYAIPDDYRAAEKPRLGDSYPGDTAPWGYIVVETGSFTAPRDNDRGGFITGVKYARAKVPFESGINGVHEIARRKRTGRLGRRMGTRVFLVADSNADALAELNFPELTPMEKVGDWTPALLREKEIERRWRVGIAKITALYDTYAQMGEVLTLGNGVLECDAHAILAPVRFADEKNTKAIEVIQYNSTTKTLRKWAVIKGTQDWPRIRAMLRVRVVLVDDELRELAPLLGKFNSDSCSKIIGATAKELWFVDFQFRQRNKYSQGNLNDCLIFLAYQPGGWHGGDINADAFTVELQELRNLQQPDYAADNATLTGMTRIVPTWIPVSGTATINVLPDKTASFNIINGYLK